MKERTGLIGATGFVGGLLAARRHYDRLYDSKSIGSIAGEHFDLVVCAGAPATMWAANSNPQMDAANLDSLHAALRSATIRRLVLVSTIAVFDDVSAGYTEDTARFEVNKPYGRHRRLLEVRANESFDCHVIRLPALFGAGLKKNFIFDLTHPIPSYINPGRFQQLQACFSEAEKQILERRFVYDEALGMWQFLRRDIGATELEPLEQAFRRANFVARDFTNSRSEFQFYNTERLADDIDTCLKHGIRTLNVCSEPIRATDIHQELFGAPYENGTPAVVREDVRTNHAGAFGATGPYLYSRGAVLSDLRQFTARSECR